jgi:hypothetical protein
MIDSVMNHPAIKYFIAAEIIDPYYVKRNHDLDLQTVEKSLQVFESFLSKDENCIVNK